MLLWLLLGATCISNLFVSFFAITLTKKSCDECKCFSGYLVVNAEVDPMEGGGLSDTGAAAAIQKAQADLR